MAAKRGLALLRGAGFDVDEAAGLAGPELGVVAAERDELIKKHGYKVMDYRD